MRQEECPSLHKNPGSCLQGALPASAELEDRSSVQRLRELDWSVGQNLLFEARYAEGKLDRLPTLATGLAQLQVSVIMAFGTPASLAANHATATIPIVVLAIRLERDS